MPNIRLAGDFEGKRRGDVVSVSDAQLTEARRAGVVMKLYPAQPDAAPEATEVPGDENGESEQ